MWKMLLHFPLALIVAKDTSVVNLIVIPLWEYNFFFLVTFTVFHSLTIHCGCRFIFIDSPCLRVHFQTVDSYISSILKKY